MLDISKWHKKFVWFAVTIDDGVVVCSRCWARFETYGPGDHAWAYSITDPRKK